MIGQTDPMSIAFQFRGLSREIMDLLDFTNNLIELRPVVQTRTLGGVPELAGWKHVISGQVKSLNAGTIAPNSTQDVNVEMAVYRWEAFENGQSVLEIDKLNFIHKVNGVDQMAALRKAMGV
jgi:P2 family phage contractile tail tube protein